MITIMSTAPPPMYMCLTLLQVVGGRRGRVRGRGASPRPWSAASWLRPGVPRSLRSVPPRLGCPPSSPRLIPLGSGWQRLVREPGPLAAALVTRSCRALSCRRLVCQAESPVCVGLT